MRVAFDPFRALRTLLAHDVRFVMIGGMAARAWGSPTVTNDLDLCYDRTPANLEALARTLRELEATLRGAPPDLPFLLDARTLAMGDSFTFDTTAGAIDCLGTPAGTSGYRDLAAGAQEVQVDDLVFRIASLDDLLRMKRAAGRPKDLIEVEVLSALAEERARQKGTS